MFIGRQKELAFLEERYQAGKFECIIIYGRRRVGKTSLINEFVKNKKVIYFTGLESNAATNLVNLSQGILTLSGSGQGSKPNTGPEAASGAWQDRRSTPVFQNFQDALDAVYELSCQEQVVLVLDEYPYLAASYPAISSLLQVQIDRKFKQSKLFLILCGSSMSFMEHQVLGYKSPLFGRRTAQLKVLPFGYFESRQFFHKYTPVEVAAVYGLTGGVPQYLLEFSEKRSLKENIVANFLNPQAYLFEEPGNLLKQELREPAQYNAVLTAIAAGYNKNSTIADKVGISQPLCTSYLQTLLQLGLIKKELPFGTQALKKSLYSLADNLFRFWYKFIPTNIALIEQGKAEIAYQLVEEQLTAYLGFVFEEICKEYLWQLNGTDTLPFTFVDLGRWWGADARKHQESEIDIVAHDARKKTALLGECKWTNAKVDVDVLEDLLDQGALLPYLDKYFWVFAKSGFTQACSQLAAGQAKIKLVTFAEMNEQIPGR